MTYLCAGAAQKDGLVSKFIIYFCLSFTPFNLECNAPDCVTNQLFLMAGK